MVASGDKGWSGMGKRPSAVSKPLLVDVES